MRSRTAKSIAFASLFTQASHYTLLLIKGVMLSSTLFFQALGDELVGLTRLGDSRRVIVRDDYRHGIMPKGCFYDDPWMDRSPVDGTLKEIFAGNHPMPLVKYKQQNTSCSSSAKRRFKYCLVFTGLASADPLAIRFAKIRKAASRISESGTDLRPMSASRTKSVLKLSTI